MPQSGLRHGLGHGLRPILPKEYALQQAKSQPFTALFSPFQSSPAPARRYRAAVKRATFASWPNPNKGANAAPKIQLKLVDMSGPNSAERTIFKPRHQETHQIKTRRVGVINAINRHKTRIIPVAETD